LEQVQDLRDLGVNMLRLSPQSQHMDAVVHLFNDVIEGRIQAIDAHEDMLPLLPAKACNGFWHGRPGLEWVSPVSERF
jgi:collagenase-like PrtC family protease